MTVNVLQQLRAVYCSLLSLILIHSSSSGSRCALGGRSPRTCAEANLIVTDSGQENQEQGYGTQRYLLSEHSVDGRQMVVKPKDACRHPADAFLFRDQWKRG